MIRFCCCLVRKEEDFLRKNYGTSGGTRTQSLAIVVHCSYFNQTGTISVDKLGSNNVLHCSRLLNSLILKQLRYSPYPALWSRLGHVQFRRHTSTPGCGCTVHGF